MAGVYGIEETGDIQRLMEFMPAISCQEDFAWLEPSLESVYLCVRCTLRVGAGTIWMSDGDEAEGRRVSVSVSVFVRIPGSPTG